MVRRLFGTKLLSETMMAYRKLDPEEHTSVQYEYTIKIFIQQNEYKHVVCKTAAILFRALCVLL